MARLSVLLPCRDAAAHLPESIASLEAQTYRDFEVIAVDDGSADETLARLEEWAARDARVRVHQGAGRGIVAALEVALESANGERIARMDADDVAHPDRFASQMALLDDASLAACGTQVRYFPRNVLREGALRYEAWINAAVEPGEITRDIFVECPIPHPTLMVERAALDAVGGYIECGWAEDYDLVLRLWSAGRPIGKVPRILLEWRESPLRLSRRDPRYSEDAFRRCKVHFLERTLLHGRRDVLICGAGPVGKAFARALETRGFHIHAFVDLDARKLGQTIHGAPVIGYESVGPPDDAFALAAVAGGEARAAIRATLAAAGWLEMRDFCAVA